MTNRIPEIVGSKPTEMVLAIDFSLDRLDVSLRGDGREWIWAHQAYDNSWPGFENS
jgi:ABC-type uncharacterized transport system YnjBCD ATPase subunit